MSDNLTRIRRSTHPFLPWHATPIKSAKWYMKTAEELHNIFFILGVNLRCELCQGGKRQRRIVYHLPLGKRMVRMSAGPYQVLIRVLRTMYNSRDTGKKEGRTKGRR